MPQKSSDEAAINAVSPKEREIFERSCPRAAVVISSAALRAGAKTKEHDGELDPVGLDEVLDVLFGSEIVHVHKKEKA